MTARIWRATIVGGLAVASVAGAGTAAVAQGRTTAATNGADQVAQATANEYVVLTSDGASVAAAEAAVQRAGGRVTKVNADVGLLTVESTNSGFVAAVQADGSVDGVARNRPIGEAPVIKAAPRPRDAEKLSAAERATATAQPAAAAPVTGDPLADKQWDMKMIGATADGSYAVDRGSRSVLVGIIDTGIDGIAPRHPAELQRRPQPQLHHRHPELFDGSCAYNTTGPAATRPTSTKAGTVPTSPARSARRVNGLGMAGVAPEAPPS